MVFNLIYIYLSCFLLLSLAVGMTTTDGNYKFSTSILLRVAFSDVLYLIELMFRVFPLSASEIPTTDSKYGFGEFLRIVLNVCVSI